MEKEGSQVLRQRYYTPNDVDLVPAKGSSLHKPIPISTVAAWSPEDIIPTVLDGFALLEASGVGIPDDARQAVLTGKKYCSAVPEDFLYFTGLVYLDVSENFLSLECFGSLFRLKQLRLACNNISTISPNLHGFHKLMALDLSYNRLDPNQLRSLYTLPCLEELDVCGNDMKTVPEDMFRMQRLRKLNAEHNKMEDNSVFERLSLIPNLRSLSLSYNFLSSVSKSCTHGAERFRMLDTLDISFNYFGSDEDVMPVINLPRILTLILYGNPLLGPTGEDTLRVYVEDLEKAAEELRSDFGAKQLEIVTEIPRRRVKKGQNLGRQAAYHDFSVVNVHKRHAEENMRQSQWREEGQKTLFSEAVSLAKKQGSVVSRGGTSGGQDFTFLTGLGDIGESSINASANAAEGVMQRVATEMGLGTSAELLRLRDQARLPPTLMAKLAREKEEELKASLRPSTNPIWMRPDGENDIGKMVASGKVKFDEEAGVAEADKIYGAVPISSTSDNVPNALFQRSMAEAQTALLAQPIELHTAMRALRFALRNPLTNYNEVPTKGFLPPRDYAKLTQSAVSRQLPLRQLNQMEASNPTARISSSAKEATSPAKVKLPPVLLNSDVDNPKKTSLGRYLPETAAAKQAREQNKQATLRQIEEVLDNLNSNSSEMAGRGGQYGANVRETIARMKGFANPNTGISGLVDMVNDIIADLEKK